MKNLIDKTGNIFTFRQRSSGQPAAKNSKSFRTSVEARTFLQQFPAVQLSQLGVLFSDENQTPLTDPVSIQAQAIKNLCKGSLVVTSPPRPTPNNTVKTPAGTTQKTGPVEYIDPVPASEPPPANPSPTDAEATETKEQPNVTKEAETPCESDPVSMTTGEELLSLPTQEMLHRLFHEDDIRLFDAEPLRFSCTCSHERISKMIVALGRPEAMDIINEQGKIQVDCEFCNAQYCFNPQETEKLFSDNKNTPSSATLH